MISPPLVHFCLIHFFRGSTCHRLFDTSLFKHPEVRSSIVEKCRTRLDNLRIDEFLRIAESIHCEEAEGVRKSLCEEYARSWQSRLERLVLTEFPKIIGLIRCDRTEEPGKGLCEEFIHRWRSGLTEISEEQIMKLGVEIDFKGTSTLKDQVVEAFIEEWRSRVNQLSSDQLQEIGVSIQNSLSNRDGNQSLPPLCRALLDCIQKGRHLSSLDELQNFIVMLQGYSEMGHYYSFIPYFLKLPVPCRDWGKKTLLQAMILQDCPAFSEQGTELEKVIQLRTWAHNKGKFSSEKLLIESYPEYQFYTRGPEELYTHFMFETGGAWCGGFAYFLQQIYELFGYESYTVNMGIPGTRITHVTTIVRIHDGDTSILSVQDPFFDLTYLYHTGKPIDYLQLLRMIANKSISKIVIKEGDNKQINFIISSNESLQDYEWYVIDPTLARRYRNREIYRARVTMESFDTFFKVKDALSAYGDHPEPLSLFLHPFSIHRDVNDAPLLLEQARAAVMKKVT